MDIEQTVHKLYEKVRAKIKTSEGMLNVLVVILALNRDVLYLPLCLVYTLISWKLG
jgi:hypothetical protein